MSPVSRGRKGKNKKAARRSGVGRQTRGEEARLSPAAEPRSAMNERERPGWFDSSIRTVLDRSDALLAAGGPRELEQATAELLGAESHFCIGQSRAGLWFEWWCDELLTAASQRPGENVDGWEAPWRLVHGLTSVGTPKLHSAALTILEQMRVELKTKIKERPQPEWLERMHRVEATGEVWRMRDTYGTRFALIATYTYPDEQDPSAFLFDIDACGLVTLVHADVFDNIEQAAGTWRAMVGESADGVLPSLVETAESLSPLAYYDLDADWIILGDESRSVMDNWFRARRRVYDLTEALSKRNMSLPAAPSLYRGINPQPMATEFTAWYVQRHGVQPDSDIVAEFAAEWMEGALPETWYSVSPHRVEFRLALISDWVSDHPVTVGVKALLPEWVRWLGERACLPERLLDRVVAAVDGGVRSQAEC